MKILQLRGENEIDYGSYSPACEGFVDAIKSLFAKPDPSKERLKQMSQEKQTYRHVRMVAENLEKDLQMTYDNHGWVSKNLPEKAGMMNVTALEYCNIDGKPITNVKDLLKAAHSQVAVIKNIAAREKPFTEYRRQVVEKALKCNDPDELQALWEKEKSRLLVNAGERVRKQYYKSPQPAIGYGLKSNTWPINYNDSKDDSFAQERRIKSNGEFQIPTQGTAKEYAEVIRELLAITIEMDKLGRENYISYWDVLDDNHDWYDELPDGDEIFSSLFSSQDSWNVFDLTGMLEYELGGIIVGLYIAMFDKKLRQAEG